MREMRQAGRAYPVEPILALVLAVHVLPAKVGVGDLAYLDDTDEEMEEVHEATDDPCCLLWREQLKMRG